MDVNFFFLAFHQQSTMTTPSLTNAATHEQPNNNQEDDNVEDNDTYQKIINFKSIRTTLGLETGICVRYQQTTRTLHLSTLLQQDDIAPLFAGAQWAGTRVWHAAIAMLQYLVDHHDMILRQGRLLELGCGLGVPGMLCHELYNTETYLTDQESILSQLQLNIETNFPAGSKIHAKPLTWSKELPEWVTKDKFHVVINCDCVYEPLYGNSWELLADTLIQLLQHNPSAIVLTSVERRNADGVDGFLCKLKKSVAKVERVWSDDVYNIEIYQAHGKAK
jgi:predicted nicotinamide N-methyase